MKKTLTKRRAYYNPDTLEIKIFLEGNQPENWLLGRKPIIKNKEYWLEKGKDRVLRKNNEKYSDPNLKEGYDYIICQICGLKRAEIGNGHIIKRHKITNDEYRKTYDVEFLKCQKLIDNVKGDKNPGYQHGGKFSPFSKNFLHYDENKVKETREKAAQSIRDNPQNQPTRIEYWLAQGLNQEEAETALSERQTTFSLEKCIEKYGPEEGLKRWAKRQQKWLENFKRQNYSEVSQKMFRSIIEIYKSDYIYFSTYERDDMKNYVNKEYRLHLNDGKTVCPDFIDIDTKKIIEFDGDYWHGERGNKERERQRDKSIKESNYMILHIREYEYKKNPEGTIEKCINFLTQ